MRFCCRRGETRESCVSVDYMTERMVTGKPGERRTGENTQFCLRPSHSPFQPFLSPPLPPSLSEESMKNGHLYLGASASTCNGLSPLFWSYVESKLKYHLACEAFSLCHITSLHCMILSSLLIFVFPKKLHLESKDMFLFTSPGAVLTRAPGTQ